MAGAEIGTSFGIVPTDFHVRITESYPFDLTAVLYEHLKLLVATFDTTRLIQSDSFALILSFSKVSL